MAETKPAETTPAQEPAAQEQKNEEMPPLEEQPAGAAPTGAEKKGSSRTEKKSRKALQKIGLKPFPGVVRVTLRQRGQNVIIGDAEVFKGTGDTYVVFGQPQAEDAQFSKAKQAQLRDVLKQAQQGGVAGLENQLKELGLEGEKKPEVAKVEEVTEEAVDETGLTQKDIELVMKQGNVSRAVAVKTLKKNNGDIVQSIMDLSGMKG